MSEYIPTIGIEAHVQLKTKTKLFAAINNDARGAEPNTLISHICVGMPGALPVLNERAVELTLRAGIALDGQAQKFSKFDRKHYFYPDLPKGYQISQYEDPLVKGGHVDIEVDGKTSRVGIVRIHLEEDAGKTIHPSGADYSLVDLNRAGTPLIEIVSSPDIHSSSEAKAYVREIYLIMKYAGVSDCDLYQGHMRFDVNVSISKNPNQPGTRTETKNLNSFRSVEAVVAYEIKRQQALLEKGETIKQETRGWDEAKQKTFSQRGKEEAEDYRYMPEPDIPPLELSEELVDSIRKNLPALPGDLRQKLNKLNIDRHLVEDLLDRPVSLSLVLGVLEKGGAEAARQAAFWVMHNRSEVIDITEESQQLNLDSERVIELASMIKDGQLNSTAALRIYNELPHTDKTPQAIADELGLVQVSDETEIEKIVDSVIKENSKVVADIKAGNDKAIAFLVGQVMAKSKGKANPSLAQKIIKDKLLK